MVVRTEHALLRTLQPHHPFDMPAILADAKMRHAKNGAGLYFDVKLNVESMSEAFRALADPTRRRVLQLLSRQPMTAGELANCFPVTKATMSAHFSILREANLIEAEKTGKTITYRLKLSVLEEALLGFADSFGIGRPAKPKRPRRSTSKQEKPS